MENYQKNLIQEYPIYSKNAVAFLQKKTFPDKNILHCDLNNFYASCEQKDNIEYKNKPLVVCGNVEERRGVVLAKNYVAKDYGIKTGMTLYEAKKLCPFLVYTNANFDRYLYYSKLVREVFLEFSDFVEPFSIDEAWIDVTHSKIFGEPTQIAVKIKEKVKKEIGLTLSVGVSFNKTMSKLASDMKKPDGVTVITPENFKQMVWNKPVEELLCVGHATKRKLLNVGLDTIGKLANAPIDYLQRKFGAVGVYLYEYANGLENKPVRKFGTPEKVKSVGNSTTCYKDLKQPFEVYEIFSILSQKIAERMLGGGIPPAKNLTIHFKNNLLENFSKRITLEKPIFYSSDIARCAFETFKTFYDFKNPIRAVGISLSGFKGDFSKFSFFDLPQKDASVSCLNAKTICKTQKQLNLEQTAFKIRQKYGNSALVKGSLLFDTKLNIDSSAHSIHPISFLK